MCADVCVSFYYALRPVQYRDSMKNVRIPPSTVLDRQNKSFARPYLSRRPDPEGGPGTDTRGSCYTSERGKIVKNKIIE